MSKLQNPNHFLKEAQEARRMARAVEDPKLEQLLLDLACYYDKLAERALRRQLLKVERGDK